MVIGINASFLRKQNTGIGQVTTNFIKKLAEAYRGKEHTFMLYMEEDTDLNLPKNFIKKSFLPKGYTRDDIFRAILWQRFMLPRHAKKDGCDVFLSMYQSATIMPKKIKHIMVVHDIILELFPNYLNNWRKKFFWKMTKKAIGKVDRIISVSKKTEKDLINILKINPKKIAVAYIDVDGIFKKEVSLKDQEKVLKKYNLKKGYIYAGGGMEVRKNMEGTVRAYKILLDGTKDMFSKMKAADVPNLVISGKPMPDLAPLATDVEGLVKSMGLEKKVKMLGFVRQEDLPSLYKNAILFSFPSFYEGFGLPVLEAMSQGTPVLTTKRSSLPEVGSDAVFYCNPDDIDDVTTALKKMLAEKDLRDDLSRKGKQRSAYFSWDDFVEKMLNIIIDLHDSRKSQKIKET